MRAWALARAVEPACDGLEKHLVDERRLAGAGDAGHDGEDAEREFDVDVAQIVLAGTPNLDDAVRLAPSLRHFNLHCAGEELAGQRALALLDFCGRPLSDYLASVLASPRTHVDEPVGGAHRLLIVLDDQNRVAQIAQVLKRLDQLAVVALVEAD